MAKAQIDIEVTGEEKLKQIQKDVEGIGTKSVALGNIYAKLAEVAVQSIVKIVDAGADYNKSLEEVNGTLVKTVDLEESLTESFGMASGALLEYTGVWELYRETLADVSNLLDVVAGKEAIIAQARADHLRMEKEYQKMLLEDEKIEERKSKARLRQIEKENDANVRHQKLLTEFEAKAEASAKAKTDAYEAELIALDKAIDAVNAETEAQIANVQAKQEAVTVTDDLTHSLEDQAGASEKASGGGSYSVTTSGATDYNALQDEATKLKMMGYNAEAQAITDRIQRQMLEELKKLNDTVGS